MAKGSVQLIISFLIIFIASFSLLYIFDSLNQLSIKCEKGYKLEICNLLKGFTFVGLVVLLLVGGLIGIIGIVAYILFSTLSK
jgi:hypothetical protein